MLSICWTITATTPVNIPTKGLILNPTNVQIAPPIHGPIYGIILVSPHIAPNKSGDESPTNVYPIVEIKLTNNAINK